MRPVSVSSPGLAQSDKSRGVWGAEPPSSVLRPGNSSGSIIRRGSHGGSEDRGSMSRVRSQTFFSHGACAAAAAAALPCPAAPRNHPFVKYGRRTKPPPHVLEQRARHWIISRSTVPPARVVLNQADVGSRGCLFPEQPSRSTGHLRLSLTAGERRLSGHRSDATVPRVVHALFKARSSSTSQ